MADVGLRFGVQQYVQQPVQYVQQPMSYVQQPMSYMPAQL
jgi:hypothetical protein